MTRPAAKRHAVPLAGRVLVAGLLAALPTIVAALPGGPADPAAAQGSDLVQVSLTSLTPVAPQPGDTLTIAGTLTNTSAEPVSNLTVELEEGTSPLIARGTFDQYAADPTGDLADNPIPLQGVASSLILPDTTLDAGAHEPFTVTLPIDSLNLGPSWQVRQLGLAVVGESNFATFTLGQLRTFLPYAPRDGGIGRKPVDLAWLWPLVDRPHRGVTATWLDSALAPELATGGRLNTLVGAALHAGQLDSGKKHSTAHDVPVTFAVDPMLLDDVDTMRSAYQVATGDPKKPAAGSGQADATAFLTDLRTATAQGNVLPLPYGDPDVTAEVRAGLSTPLLGLAHTGGNAIVQHLLPSATDVNGAWPPGGLLDQRSVDALLGVGVDSLVLTDQALPIVGGQPNETPSAHASLSTDAGTVDAALSDPYLSGAVNEGAQPGADSVLATQRVLAETLMIEAEAPSDQRDIVIAPARRWAPTAQYADALLADTGRVPWLRPVTLSQVLASPVWTKVERAPLSYPASAKRAELSPDYMKKISALQQTVSRVSSILPPADRSTLPYGAALLRSASSAWRNDPFTRDQQYGEVSHAVDDALNSVRIASTSGSHITLTSHGGQFPVTIANDLDVPVNVTVELEPTPRLTFAHGGREQRTIPAHQLLAVDFRATAKTSGVFPVFVHLLTPDGHVYNTERRGTVELFVRSTVYGTITLVITAAATAVLLVAVAVRLTRRALAARRTAAAH